jgi:hypothetical protein
MARRLTKIMLLAGTCLALAAPANAQINWSGYGELSGGGGEWISSDAITSGVCVLPPPTIPPPPGWTWTQVPCRGAYDFHIPRTEVFFNGNVHANAVFTSGFGIQLDAEGFDDRFTSRFVYGSGNSTTGYGFGLHLNQGDGDYRAGVMFSGGNVANDWLFSVGPEGEWFFKDVTLFAQGVYSHGTPSGGNMSSSYLHTGLRYFYSGNLMFEGGFGTGTAQINYQTHYQTQSTSDHIEALQLDAKAEYLFHDFPLRVDPRS